MKYQTQISLCVFNLRFAANLPIDVSSLAIKMCDTSNAIKFIGNENYGIEFDNVVSWLHLFEISYLEIYILYHLLMNNDFMAESILDSIIFHNMGICQIPLYYYAYWNKPRKKCRLCYWYKVEYHFKEETWLYDFSLKCRRTFITLLAYIVTCILNL